MTVVTPVEYFTWREERSRRVDFKALGEIDYPRFKKMAEVTASRYLIKGYILVRGKSITGAIQGFEADIKLMTTWLKTKRPGMNMNYVKIRRSTRVKKKQIRILHCLELSPHVG